MSYKALAPIYDRIMCHVEYEEWIELIDKIVKKHINKDNVSIFEIGGGTGVLGEHLKEHGYEYTGSELSLYMSQEAVKKNIPYFCADARLLPVKKQFDVVLFLYDGINYLQTIQEYKKVFSEVSECLNRGGIFLFDITTEYNSMEHFYDFIDFEEFSDCSVIRHSYYDELMSIQHNDFTIFNFDPTTKKYDKFTDKHIQKVFPAQLIEEAIPVKTFETVGIWDEFRMKKYSTRSERIHFCLKRK